MPSKCVSPTEEDSRTRFCLVFDYLVLHPDLFSATSEARMSECPNIELAFSSPKKENGEGVRSEESRREGPPAWPAHAQTVRSFECSPLPFFLPSLPPPPLQCPGWLDAPAAVMRSLMNNCITHTINFFVA